VNSFASVGLKPIFRYPLYIKGAESIKIGNNFYTGPGFRIEVWNTDKNEKNNIIIEIGNNVSFNFNCHIGAINKIMIKDNVMVGSNVLITDHSHGTNTGKETETPTWERPLFSKGHVIIEDNVWIGENVCILPNVTIGKNSIIGCNSVINKNIPPNVIAAGNPAKIIKELS